jgi:hypothetical protein
MYMGTYTDRASDDTVVIPEYPDYYTERDEEYHIRRFDLREKRYTGLEAGDGKWWLFHGDYLTVRHTNMVSGQRPISFEAITWDNIPNATVLELL